MSKLLLFLLLMLFSLCLFDIFPLTLMLYIQCDRGFWGFLGGVFLRVFAVYKT